MTMKNLVIDLFLYCDVGVKGDPMMLTDFFAFHAPEILKTFEIRTFFCEKWLLSHVLRVLKSCIFMQA